MKTLTHLGLRQEFNRRKSRRLTLLSTFQKEGELTTKELQRFGTGVSSRIKELRNEGHKIVPVHIKGGMYRYVYLGQSEDDGTNVSVID